MNTGCLSGDRKSKVDVSKGGTAARILDRAALGATLKQRKKFKVEGQVARWFVIGSS